MWTKTILTAGLLVSSLGLAHAGDVALYNDSWDNIPQVMVIRGLNAPNSGNVDTYNNVKRGFVTSGSSRLCYKRSSNPNNSSSALQSNWTCASQTVSGTYDLKM